MTLGEQIKKDDGFQSKRKQVTITSILLLAMSLSNAQLKDANTFIFKIEFSNSAAFGWLIFLGVFVLTIRYYSVAFKYHKALFNMWADNFLYDPRLFLFFKDSDSPDTPYGLLSKMKSENHSENSINPFTHSNQVAMKYEAKSILRRYCLYSRNVEGHNGTKKVNLHKFDNSWTRKKFYKLLLIELEFRRNALFRSPEYLDIFLPYIVALLSLLSFLFKHQIIQLFN